GLSPCPANGAGNLPARLTWSGAGWPGGQPQRSFAAERQLGAPLAAAHLMILRLQAARRERRSGSLACLASPGIAITPRAEPHVQVNIEHESLAWVTSDTDRVAVPCRSSHRFGSEEDDDRMLTLLL